MSTCSLAFLASFFLVSTILVVQRELGFRQGVLTLASAGFIASFRPTPATLVVTAAFLLASWGVLALVARKPSGRSVFVGVTGAVIFLIALKSEHSPEHPNDQWVSWTNTVGLSYMVFKFIQVLVDVSQGQVRRLSFMTYLNYQLAFFTLTQGPINRYNDFEATWNEEGGSSPGPEETFSQWSRIFSGVIKMGIVAPFLGSIIANGTDWVDPGTIPHPYLRPLLQFYLFPWQIYFDFSGYTDIVVACARLLGFKLPENFNRPFGARNLIDFWDRWHMSLTQWLRVYLFMASYRYVAEHQRKHLRTAGYVLMGLTLLVFGLWHGFTTGYFLFGIVSGLGVVVTRIWGDVLSARLGRAGYRRYLEHGGIRTLAILGTFHFVCFSELFFALDFSNLLALGQGVLDAARPSTAMLMRMALIPAAASLIVLAYARWARGGTMAKPGAAEALPWPIPRAFGGMALRASLVALFLIGQTLSQATVGVGFYRTF